MQKNKSSLSDAESYKEIGEFWDSHDVTEFWNETSPVEFQVEIESEATYFPVEMGLSTQIVALAKRQGISPETLLNLWIQEKVRDASAAK